MTFDYVQLYKPSTTIIIISNSWFGDQTTLLYRDRYFKKNVNADYFRMRVCECSPVRMTISQKVSKLLKEILPMTNESKTFLQSHIVRYCLKIWTCNPKIVVRALNQWPTQSFKWALPLWVYIFWTVTSLVYHYDILNDRLNLKLFS